MGVRVTGAAAAAMVGLSAVLVGCSALPGGVSEPSAAEAEICAGAEAFATDVGTDAYSWRASVEMVERAAFDQEGPVADAADEFVAGYAQSGRAWDEPFIDLAEACADAGAPVVSDPVQLLCDFDTLRREQNPGYIPERDWCA